MPERELTASIPPQNPPAAGRPEAPRFDTPERLEAALRQTGFTGLQIHSEDADFLYSQDEEWWESLWSHGLRSRLERLEAPVLAQVKSDMLHKVRALKQSDGIHAVFRALYAVGAKPESSPAEAER